MGSDNTVGYETSGGMHCKHSAQRAATENDQGNMSQRLKFEGKKFKQKDEILKESCCWNYTTLNIKSVFDVFK
jgi:hypothetical protein